MTDTNNEPAVLAEPARVPIGQRLRRLIGTVMTVTVGDLVRWTLRLILAVILLGAAVVFVLVHYPDTQIPAPEPLAETRYLDQGWGAARDSPQRETYYYTPQGTSVKNLRYSWFVNLERPLGNAPVRRSGAPARPRLHRRSGADARQSRSAARRVHAALRRAPRRGRARHHVRGLPHRPDQHHARRPDDRHPDRRRRGDARVHRGQDRPLRAGAPRLDGEHVRQPVQVRSVRAEGARRRGLRPRQRPAALGVPAGAPGPAGASEEQADAQTLPD